MGRYYCVDQCFRGWADWIVYKNMLHLTPSPSANENCVQLDNARSRNVRWIVSK